MKIPIKNMSWQSTAHDINILLLLILLTIFIECGLFYFYAKKKNYKDIDEAIIILITANFISGFVGFLIGVFAVR